MASNRVTFVFFALLLGTWPHFQDPPSGNAARDDPRVGSAPQRVSPLSLFFLPLVLFVHSIVIFLTVAIGVLSFVFVATFGGVWRVLYDFYGRTWDFHSKLALLLLLLLGNAARMPFQAQRMSTEPTSFDAKTSMPPGFREIVAAVQVIFFEGIPCFVDGWRVERIRRRAIRNHHHSLTKQMLLVMSGVER